MKRCILSGLLFWFLVSFLAGTAGAEIVWDYSPDATGAGVNHACYTNQVEAQQLAEKIVFDDSTSLGGMDIYSSTDAGGVGQLVKIQIWSDIGGEPGALLYEFDETISIIDNEGTVSQGLLSRKHADFSTPVDLSAGTYWVAMTSATAGISLCQASLSIVDDDRFAWCHSGSFTIMSAIGTGDMAFRLHGIQSPKATWMIDTVVDTKYFELGSSHSIAVDSGGAPHIVYGGDHLYHAYYEGGVWYEEMIDSAPGVGVDATIAIDASDSIHILYENYISFVTSSAEYKYATNASGSWVIEPLDFFPVETDDLYRGDLKIVVDRSGMAHLIYIQEICTEDDCFDQIMHATNTSGEWVVEVAADTTGENAAAYGQLYDAAIGNDGSIHILSKMWPYLKDITNVSGAWVKETIVGVWNGGHGAAICLDSVGTVHVAYGATIGYGDNAALKYAARTSSGEWVTDTATIDPINIANAVGYVSIDVDNSNIVHVSYADLSTNTLKYARGVADSWVVENVASVETYTRYSSYNSIAVSNAGTAYISFWDRNKAAVQYATNPTGSWLIQTVQKDSSDPRDISMASDPSGNVHISYYDLITKQLRYAAGTYGNWSLETISDSGKNDQLAVDPDGAVQIISRDKLTGKGRHVSNSSGAWVTTALDFDWNYNNSFIIDESGKMHVNYSFRTGVYPAPKYIHLMYGTAATLADPWTIDEIKLATTLYEPEYLPEYLDPTSMVIDVFGNAHIMYTLNDQQLFYTTNATGAWVEEMIAELPGEYDFFMGLSFAVDVSGNAHVIYTDLFNNWQSTRLVYINNVSGTWTAPDTVDVWGNGLYEVDVAFDSKGQLHISYDARGKGLQYAVGSYGSWTTSVVDATPSISLNKITVDNSDNVHIVYREYGSRDLKYATTSPYDEWGQDGTDPSFDGNGDGIPDSGQSEVASFHTSNGDNYLTLAVPAGVIIQNVEPVDNPAPINTPEGVEFPLGFIKFTLTDIPPERTVTAHFYLPEGSSPSTYWQYGPTPENPNPHWYEFLFDGTTGAEFDGNEILLHFVDGQRGDHDLAANGTIIDPGAPGFVQSVSGDLDGDGDVDGVDRSVLLASLRKCEGSPGYNAAADYDGDGCITFSDYRQWYIYYRAFLAEQPLG